MIIVRKIEKYLIYAWFSEITANDWLGFAKFFRESFALEEKIFAKANVLRGDRSVVS
ncbi:hypothetical protein [Chryseobacterium oryctis]|uniref:Uncharacterized protein n=1 Tax=Chryseobacterium oryctis TaxID=2952618 RepID=A0ABT3HKC2_9FLAO|nr:hypothetical protein [Chryseobacterium oryctis]MCW3160163.1 hypothetical protein [Chryseobacterium oryctis]